MKVLIALDGSACSDEALSRLGSLLPLQGAEVEVLVVSKVLVDVGTASGVPMYTAGGPTEAPTEHEAHAILVDARRVLEGTGAHVRGLRAIGDPGIEIVAQAQRGRPDLVIVGSHGRGLLGRLMLGSVSDYVVKHAPVPVLVVRRTPADRPGAVTMAPGVEAPAEAKR